MKHDSIKGVKVIKEGEPKRFIEFVDLVEDLIKTY